MDIRNDPWINVVSGPSAARPNNSRTERQATVGEAPPNQRQRNEQTQQVSKKAAIAAVQKWDRKANQLRAKGEGFASDARAEIRKGVDKFDLNKITKKFDDAVKQWENVLSGYEDVLSDQIMNVQGTANDKNMKAQRAHIKAKIAEARFQIGSHKATKSVMTGLRCKEDVLKMEALFQKNKKQLEKASPDQAKILQKLVIRYRERFVSQAVEGTKAFSAAAAALSGLPGHEAAPVGADLSPFSKYRQNTITGMTCDALFRGSALANRFSSDIADIQEGWNEKFLANFMREDFTAKFFPHDEAQSKQGMFRYGAEVTAYISFAIESLRRLDEGVTCAEALRQALPVASSQDANYGRYKGEIDKLRGEAEEVRDNRINRALQMQGNLVRVQLTALNYLHSENPYDSPEISKYVDQIVPNLKTLVEPFNEYAKDSQVRHLLKYPDAPSSVKLAKIYGERADPSKLLNDNQRYLLLHDLPEQYEEAAVQMMCVRNKFAEVQDISDGDMTLVNALGGFATSFFQLADRVRMDRTKLIEAGVNPAMLDTKSVEDKFKSQIDWDVHKLDKPEEEIVTVGMESLDIEDPVQEKPLKAQGSQTAPAGTEKALMEKQAAAQAKLLKKTENYTKTAYENVGKWEASAKLSSKNGLAIQSELRSRIDDWHRQKLTASEVVDDKHTPSQLQFYLEDAAYYKKEQAKKLTAVANAWRAMPDSPNVRDKIAAAENLAKTRKAEAQTLRSDAFNKGVEIAGKLPPTERTFAYLWKRDNDGRVVEKVCQPSYKILDDMDPETGKFIRDDDGNILKHPVMEYEVQLKHGGGFVIHFHCENENFDPANPKIKPGSFHFKTLAQAHRGAQSQRRDVAAGFKKEEIHRGVTSAKILKALSEKLPPELRTPVEQQDPPRNRHARNA